MTVTTITSKWPRLGIEYLAWAILLVTLYLILQRIMSKPFFRDRMMAFATVAAFLIGIAFVAFVLRDWAEWWRLVGRLAAPPLRPSSQSLVFGNPSAVMTVSVLLTASAVAFLTGGSRRRSAIAVLAVGLSLVVALLTGSRSGWLGLAIATGTTAVLWLLIAEHRRAVTDLVRSRTLRRAAIPVVIAGFVLLVIAAPGIITRATSGGEAWRTSFYEASIAMFRASPLVGLGPGMWAPQRASFTVDTNIDYYVPHAHDLYLQTAAEYGILGVAAGTVVIFLLLRLLYRSIRSDDAARRRVGWCALFATIYFGAHQLLDFYANAPAILFAFAIPIAWLDAASDERPFVGFDATARRIGAVIGVVAIVGSVGVLAWAEAGAAIADEGRLALDAGDVPRAVPSLARAVSSDPSVPPYRFALGLALAKEGRLAEAEQQFLASASVDDLPETWLDLAAVRARLGDVHGCTRRPRQGDASGAAANWRGARVPGWSHLELGDREAAIDAFSQALGTESQPGRRFMVDARSHARGGVAGGLHEDLRCCRAGRTVRTRARIR